MGKIFLVSNIFTLFFLFLDVLIFVYDTLCYYATTFIGIKGAVKTKKKSFHIFCLSKLLHFFEKIKKIWLDKNNQKNFFLCKIAKLSNYLLSIIVRIYLLVIINEKQNCKSRMKIFFSLLLTNKILSSMTYFMKIYVSYMQRDERFKKKYAIWVSSLILG